MAGMEHGEMVAQVMLKPNCGLENTRASLVVRRVAPLCDLVSCHPCAVKSDRGTIPYLRDHGLFIRFTSQVPEQVIAAIRGAFFVDRCTLVEDPDAIPPFDALAASDDEGTAGGSDQVSGFAHRDARSKRDDELSGLIARFEEMGRALRAHAESLPGDRTLNDIAFSHAQAVDNLRAAVALSRIEPFDRIAPSLHKLVEDYSRQFNIPVDLELAEGHMDLDRSVLESVEETLKRALRSCIRDGIESVDKRLALGKPARATIRVRMENEGSEIVCRIEHDGVPFVASYVGDMAAKHGLLTRPLHTYSEDEIGAFLLLPRFIPPGMGDKGNAFAEFNEIGSLLQHAGGRGEVRNTERGTMEIVLCFPVPFTMMEAALVRAGNMRFLLPAQQIRRFEAFDPSRIERADGAPHPPGTPSAAWCVEQDGGRCKLLNQLAEPSPLDAEQPAYLVLLEALGEKCALAADAVEGYEQISILPLPPLLDRRETRALGCIGYAMLEDGSPCIVLSVRRLLGAAAESGGGHA